MLKVCKNCDKKFTSIKTCKRHVEKRICLKRIEKKWQKIKNNMKLCEKCGSVLSNQYSLNKHLTKQVPCIKKELNLSLIKMQREFVDKDKIGRKKFLLKKEILCEKIGIDANQTMSLISLTEKPTIDCYDINNENVGDYSNEELLIFLKDKIKTINKISGWVDTAWELLKELSPENINFQSSLIGENSNIEENSDISSNEVDLNNTDTKNGNSVLYTRSSTNTENGNAVLYTRSATNTENDKAVLHTQTLCDTHSLPKTNYIKENINSIKLKVNLTLNEVMPNTMLKEQKEWDSIVENDDYGPLFNELHGYWNTDNFIIKPVRHYSDYYNRSLLVRNMRTARMLSSIICPHFYPNYKSSLDTKVYIDVNKKKSMWLLDDNNKWNSVPFSVGIKNMIFHAVSAYVDMIRREKEILPENSIGVWELEQISLQNCHGESYKLVVKNLISRIPKLSIHPEEEEKKLITEYLNNEEYKIDILTEISNEYINYAELPMNVQNSLLYQRIIHNIRFQNKIKKAKMYHSDVNK